LCYHALHAFKACPRLLPPCGPRERRRS
jgi:hypothetical protein